MADHRAHPKIAVPIDGLLFTDDQRTSAAHLIGGLFHHVDYHQYSAGNVGSGYHPG